MFEEVETIKKNHLNNYKNAVKEIINNNNHFLFKEDINSLLKKPPLDSMDVIKTKLYSLSKKENIVVNTEYIEKVILDYRSKIVKKIITVEDIRKKDLLLIINNFDLAKRNDVIRIKKKEFDQLNKKIIKIIKNDIQETLDDTILKDMDKIFSDDVEEEIKQKIIDEFQKYVSKKYIKQLIENIEIKILVKDTTLINGLKEQGERYIFTIKNSRLFQENENNED